MQSFKIIPSLQDDVSALHIAVEHNRTEIVETLVLEHKMDKEDLNARDNVRAYKRLM